MTSAIITIIKKMNIFSCVVILGLGVSVYSANPYCNQGEWPPTCKEGSQSPIEIDTNRTVPRPGIIKLEHFHVPFLDRITIKNADYLRFEFHRTWNGYPPTIRYKNYNFFLIECHFHFPSEHKVNGHFFNVELHCLFLNSKFQSAEEAGTHKDGSITAVWFGDIVADQDPYRHRGFDAFVVPLYSVRQTSSQTSVLSSLSFSDIIGLTAKKRGYFSYTGSSPYPPCGPRLYLIFEAEIRLPVTVMASLILPRTTEDNFHINNRRFLQDTAGREISYHRDYADLCEMI